MAYARHSQHRQEQAIYKDGTLRLLTPRETPATDGIYRQGL